MFMMFVNDIMTNINTNLNDIFSIEDIKLFLILYADDQVLFATSPPSLELMLKGNENYCYTYKLKINTNKTKVMIFHKGERHLTHDFYLY